MSLPALANLPPWSSRYGYKVRPSVVRTANRGGATTQRKRSHRKIMIGDVELRLKGAELPYFEWFVRGICNNGQSKFYGQYVDGDGVKTGIIRIVGGKYSVSTDLVKHTVKCQIEIFR